MRNLFNELYYSKFARFVFVGVCSTGIDFAVYILLSLYMTITPSKGISMICSSMFSYFVNKIFTFEVKEKTNVVYLVKFYFVFAANFGSNLLTNYLLYNWLGSKVIGFIGATLVGMTVNYWGQKFIVFKK